VTHRLIREVIIVFHHSPMILIVRQVADTDRRLVQRVSRGMRMWHGFC
jgi:hypothetical protein